MRKNKIFVIGFITMLYWLTVSVAFANPKAFPTNHFMANNLAVSPSGEIAPPINV